jgi:hypothetical protein
MSTTQLHSAETIGAELERYRLERRTRRATLVVAALRERASDANTAPWHLFHLIADFEAQIKAMDARLRDLSGPGERATHKRSGPVDANDF